MTAAHCLEISTEPERTINPKNMKVQLGHSEVRKGISIPVKSTLIHEFYDVGLIKLSYDLTFSNTITNVILPSAKHINYGVHSQ